MARHRFPLIAALAVLACLWTEAPASAQGRFLAKEDIVLYGLGLKVDPAVQTVPKDIATIVSTYLQAPQIPGQLPPFAPDAVVKGTLRGPGLPVPLTLSVQPNSPFNIPPLTVAGVYTLDDIRLESQGTLLLRSTPESVKITVIDKLLVTQITARPLTAAEIREKGIVFDASNFQAYNFTAAFAVSDGTPVNVNFPVVLPSLPGVADTAAPVVTIGTVQAPAITSLKTVVPDTLKLAQTQIPNLSVVGFTLKVPELAGQELMVPPIPGVIVIPGDIGFLNQYFSVMLMVGNAAPIGSGLSVTDLRAEIVLPAGNDRVVNTVDDPLRMAMTTHGEAPRMQPVVQAGPDGQLGTADDIVTLAPGESGNAEFLVEGRREGSHTVEMAITGTLLGLPVGPVPVTGRAVGAVLVRNPTFTLTFTHPDVVAAGEQYALDVTVTNTSTSPANFVSVNLFAPNVSGATVVGDATRQIETIPPGDSASVSFDLVSRVSGKVTAATLDSDENVAGRFQLKTAVGADGVPLSPDSLVLPKEASSLPKSLRDAALGLLGKAWAVATAPAGALPKDTVRFSKQIVLDRAVELAEAGLRVSLHEPAPDSAAQLLMDFAGSNYPRIAELYPAADQPFHRTNFTGFDGLRRTSVRGDAFAAAVASLLRGDLAANGPAAFHHALAARWGYRPGFVSVLLSSASAPTPFDLAIVDAQGRRVGGTGANGKFLKEIPFSDVLAFTDDSGHRTATLLLIAAPDPGTYTVRLTRVAGTPADAPSTLSILSPTADQNGDVRQLVFDGVTASSQLSYTAAAADPIRFAFQVLGDDVPAAPAPVAAVATLVADAAPSVISVVQQAQADVVSCDAETVGFPFGRVVAVLFSEEVSAASVQDRLAADQITAFAPEANQPAAVALQPGRRIAFVALRRPFGPYIPRTMTVSGVQDLRQHALGTWTGPMEATVGDNGAVVSGRIIQGDGTAVAGAEVRLFAMLPCPDSEPAEKKVGISSQYADADGRYSWDFVNSSLRAVITGIDPGTSEWRSITFDISRPGQRMNVDVVLLGRGTFMGRVLSPNGRTPLPDTQIRVTSLTDHSQYGARTDAQGAFVITRIPVGNIFVEAVNVAANAHYNFSEYLPFAGATVSRDIVLIAADSAQQRTAKYSSLSGHVLKADGATVVAGAPVVAYYSNNSQSGVSCAAVESMGELVVPSECAVGVATTGSDGAFGFTDLPIGNYRIYAFDQPSLAQGEIRYVLGETGASGIGILLSGGLATVRGVVLDSTGAKVPGARVGGGLTLTTTDANGEFVLGDVPIGRREIVAVSDALGVTGYATVDIVAAGETVNATIVLPLAGSVAGRVVQADGVTPAANVAVYVFHQEASEDGPKIVITGEATTDATGAYRIDHVLAGQYQVSAFAADFSDGNVVPAVLRYANQVVRADIRFRGAGGRVSGTVFNSDGNTPLIARVGLSGYRALIAGGKVGVGFVPVTNYAIVDTGLDGKFSFNGLFVGDFTLRAVGAFSPDPIAESGRIDTAGQQVTLNLRLQATSQVAGIVYQPDGVTPAPNVNVTYKSDAFRLVCSGFNEAGDPSCDAVPQGVQAEYAVTDANGRFLVPLVNAGPFTLSFTDPVSGKVGQLKGSVRPGERAEMAGRLLGRGVLTIHVVSSDGHTPIPGARVEVQQPEFPKAALTMFADAQGTLVLSGGDALSEGEATIAVRDVRNGFTGRASARIAQDGENVSVSVYIFDAWGTVSGHVYKPDGITPVPNAEVVISVAGKAIGYTVTDAGGAYTQDTIPLGPFSVDVFEAATARIGYGSGSIDLDKQQVTVNVTEVAMGLVTGTVIDSSVMAPLPGWSVILTPMLASGRTLEPLRGMSAADGQFSFPGVAKGVFTLIADKAGVSGSARGSGEIYAEGQQVDVPLLVQIVHPVYGTIEGTVKNPDGTPAAYANVRIQDGPQTTALADGSFSFSQMQLGRYLVIATAQTSANAGSTFVDLAFKADVVRADIVMVGLTAVHGQVVYADNTPASGAQVTFIGVPASGCGEACVKYADGNGQFAFTQLPARSFTVWASDPVRNLKGSVGGPLNPGEDKALRVVLQPSAVVQGRVLTAGGLPAAGVTCELRIGDQQLFLGTGSDGRFSYAAVPLGAYTLDFSDPIGPGIARRAGTLTGDANLGDIALDEAPPQVVNLTPAASATRVPLNQVVTIVFSEPIDPAGVSAAGIALQGPAGPVASLLALGAGDTTVTLTPLEQLKDEFRYTLKLTGIKDRLAKVMPDYTAAFTTVDITPPSPIDLSPAQGASGVPIYSPIRIKFSEPIDPAAWGASPLSLTLNGTAVAGRFDYLYGNTVVAFTPNLPLADGSTYRLQVAAAADLAGNRQAQPLDFTFSTTDRTPPQIAGLSALTGPSVIENTTARVRPDFGATADVAVVDYYLNGNVAGSSRTAPFDFAFQAIPALGSPGDTISVTAIATDTSGNRGLMSAPLAITVSADVPPAIEITTPANGASFPNGTRVTVSVHASDDVGLVSLGYKAQTGRPQDAATVQVSPVAADRTASFAFDVPNTAAPGAAIEIQASAVDTKGQTTPAAPVSFTVLDAVAPVAAISGGASGDKVKAGQTVTVSVNASDAGGLKQVTFAATGAAQHSETRPVTGAPTSLVTAFTFTVSSTASTGDTIALDATATDVANNSGTAARVVLTVGDVTPPAVTLRSADGSTTVLPGQTVDVVAQASDDQAVAKVDLTGEGAFSLSDSKQVSPPSNSAALHFAVLIPASATPGTSLTLTARATDVSGNVSGPGTLALLITSSTDVTMPGSLVMLAGETKSVPVQLAMAAPAGGQTVTFAVTDTSIAVAPSTLTIPEGQTQGSITLTAVSGGTTSLRAYVQGAARATTTIAVQGGVVSGLVLDDLLAPVAGAEVTVGSYHTTTTDAAGFYQVTGVTDLGLGNVVLVKAVDPVSHKRGSVTAQLNTVHGFDSNVNVVLIAAGGVSGTVYRADGTTPAGAGVQVDIYDQSQPAVSLNTTFTDEASHFEFPVVTQGAYNVEARDTGGNRGRATAMLAPGQDVAANVSYLGRGTVTGTVRDGTNTPVPNAQVVFNASSIFGQPPATSLAAGPDGTFSVPSVFVGSFWVRATDPRNGQGGIASGSIAHDQETVPIDVQVASFGTLQGTVYRSDGTTTVANAHVTAQRDQYTYLWATTDSSGHYQMPVVPLGTYSIDVTESATRGMGRTQAVLTTNGETQTADVTLLAQGTLVVTVTDANAQPVSGASVAVAAANDPYRDYLSGVTGADGRVVISRVLAGTFAIEATYSGLTGHASGSLGGGATVPVTVALEPIASIAGTVLMPDGQTPAAGIVKVMPRYSIASDPALKQSTLAADGTYRFDGLPMGGYKVYAYDAGGRWRAVSLAITLGTPGEVKTADLAFVGLGTVSGRVLNIDSSSAGNTPVEVRSLNPVFGGFHTARTDAAGNYQVTGVVTGGVSVTAGSVASGLFAEASGTVAGDGQTAVVDLLLKNNSTYFPVTLHDANGSPFEIGADGMVKSGQDVYGFLRSSGGLKLEIESGGVTAAFTGSTVGTFEAGGRQVVTRQEGVAGLDVTRRVFVPQDGYFARYVDVLRNPGTTPVSVNLWVTSYTQLPTLVRTSSGDTALDVADATTADRWFTLDDDSDNPNGAYALAFVFDGPGAPARAASAAFAPWNSALWRWNDVTVPAGGSVAFVYFVAQQETRAAAQASAERLVQLPPEALASLRHEELAAVCNFAVPADGTSTLASLPALTGVITGQALEADGTTPVPWTQVNFTSASPYFARTRTFYADANGAFRVQPQLDGTQQSVPIPLGAFTLIGTYPTTSVGAPVVTGTFPAGQSLVAQNIVFTTTASVHGSVRRADGTVAGSGTVVLAGTRNGQSYSRSTTIASDGSFSFVGQPPMSATLTATVPHPQGSGLTASVAVTLVAGQASDVTLTLPATGTVQGTVRNGGGSAAASVSVRLSGTGDFARTVTTDTSGAYTLTNVPAGSFTLTATEPASGLPTTTSITVAAGQATTQDLQLVAVGIVRGTVFNATNTAVPNLPVDLVTSLAARGTLHATTNASGGYQFSGVPLGSFLVSATSTALGQYGEVAGTLGSDGEQVVADITMAANIIPLPRTKYDANSFSFQLQQNGRIRTGYNSAFTGPSSTTSDPYGASRLSLIVGPTETAFAGAANAIGEHGNRELAIRQQGIAGLDVTRKIYLPETGYFARYLEILSNPGATPVTVNVKVASSLGYASYSWWWGWSGVSPAIRATSSGDTTLDVSSADAPDRWIVLDDSEQTDLFARSASGNSQPATAFVFDGAGAASRVASAAYTRPAWGDLTYQWNAVTVPAGGKVILMHFVVQQSSTAAGTASAERLAQLPPEAIAGIADDERPLVANFALPADGSSVLAALPSLTGVVTGRVLEADGTAVVNSVVEFSSSLPYFSRSRRVYSDGTGTFRFTSAFTQYGNTAVPVDAFTLTASHPASSIASLPVAGSFPDGASSASQDVTFTNTGTLTGYLRKQSGTAVGGNWMSVIMGNTRFNQSTDDAGRFVFRGLAPGAWSMQATLSTSPWLVATATATATGGQTVTQDLIFPPTGGLQGVVYTAAGTRAESQNVSIRRPSDGQTNSTYSYDGSFLFTDIPLGSYTLVVTDSRTSARSEVPVTIVENQVTTQDITLPAAGSLQVQVNYARGVPAGGARVDVKDSGTGTSFGRSIWVDAAGRGTVTNVAAGAVTVRAYHPGNSDFYTDAETTLASEGQVVPVTVTLPVVVTVAAHTTVSTGTAVAGARASLYRSADMTSLITSATTDASGVASLGLRAGGVSYTVRAERTVASYNSYNVSAQSAAFTPVADGETVTAEVALPAVANATVALVKPDGTSFGISQLYVKNAYRTNFEDQGYTDSTTGRVGLPLPEGAYTIQVRDFHTGARLLEQSGTIQAADEGTTPTITITVGALSGNVTGQVFTADGTTPLANAYVYLLNAVDRVSLGYTSTGADGRFTFSNVRAGTGGFIVRANLPSQWSSAYPDGSVEVPGSFTTAGETQTVNVTMPFASMTVSGVVHGADGTSTINYSRVRIVTKTGTTLWSGTTNGSGAYGPATVLADATGVNVRAYEPNNIVFAEQLQAPGTTGGTYTVNLNVPVNYATLSGMVRAADGSTGVRYADMRLETSAGTLTTFWAGSEGAYSASYWVPVDGARLSAQYSDGVVPDRAWTSVPISVQQGQTLNVNITLPLSVVRGHVRQADATVPSSFDAWTVGADSQTRETMMTSSGSGSATFTILGTPPGPFRTYVEDGYSPYFTGSVEGTIGDISVPVDVDVVLPAAGQVDLTTLDEAGMPVGAWVALAAAGASSYTDQRTDATTGRTLFTAPAGPVAVQACFGNGPCTIVSTTVSAGQVTPVTLRPPATGTLQGRVLKADGVTPYANTSVYVESKSGAGWEGSWDNWVTTAADGTFSLTGVPAGTAFVEVYDYAAKGAIRVPVTILAGKTNTMEASGGSGVAGNKISSGGAEYQMYDDGSISSATFGTLGNPYAGSYSLRLYEGLNSETYSPDASLARLVGPGTQLEYGSVPGRSLIVDRKVMVPGNKPWVRFLETVRNPTDLPLPVAANITGFLRDYNALLPAASGNRYLITGPASAGTRAAVATVIGGAGTPGVKSGLSLDPGSSFNYVWATVVPPGGVVSFMHFSVIGDPADVAGLQAQAEALSTLSDADALVGLTNEEKGRILNFTVPGGVPVKTGSIAGAVLDVGGVPAAGTSVQAVDALTGHIWASATTDAAGAFLLQPVSNSDYGIAVIATVPGAPGRSTSAAVTFTQAGEAMTGVVLTLPAGPGGAGAGAGAVAVPAAATSAAAPTAADHGGGGAASGWVPWPLTLAPMEWMGFANVSAPDADAASAFRPAATGVEGESEPRRRMVQR